MATVRRLYYLEREDCGYDEVETVTVQAASPKSARAVAAAIRVEGAQDFLDPEKSEITLLGTASPSLPADWYTTDIKWG